MSWDPVWEKIFKSQEWGSYPEPELIRFVARNFYKASDRHVIKILELGCGTGANLWYLAREGFSFAGIDGSETAVLQASARLDLECPDWKEISQVTLSFFDTLPFENGTFDAIIDNEAVSCNSISDSLQAYKESARVLKKGGRIFARMFAPVTWGYGLGKKVDKDTFYDISEGPLFQRGRIRFTPAEEIYKLLPDFELDPIDWVARSIGDGKEIREWIVTGTKRG
jgi:SAM-dependent methyltransferase